MTVQGETIANQFANRLTASYNMEMFVAGTARQAMISKKQEVNDNRYEIMESLVHIARNKYRKLLDHPKFMNFYAQATPIDVLEQSRIGSRPARRTGQRTIDDLRAIPWVFSWSQARFNITGWFGSGMAFDEFKKQHPNDFETLKILAKDWSFLKYSFIQIESNMLNADTEVMKKFAYPVVFDATHSVQLPGGGNNKSSGQKEFIDSLSTAAVSLGISGVFAEVHDNPKSAISDSENQLDLEAFDRLTKKLMKFDALAKNN